MQPQPLHPTVDLIFKTITNLLHDYDEEEITFSKIARHAYLQKSSVAYHFPSKKVMMEQYYIYFLESVIDRNWEKFNLEETGEGAVKVFCQFIDAALGSQDTKEESARDKEVWKKVNREVFVRIGTGTAMKKYFEDLLAWQTEDLRELFRVFIDAGILEPSRLDQATYEFAYLSITRQLLQIFEIELPGCEQAHRRFVEELKRNFLKDGLYPPKIEEKTE